MSFAAAAASELRSIDPSTSTGTVDLRGFDPLDLVGPSLRAVSDEHPPAIDAPNRSPLGLPQTFWDSRRALSEVQAAAWHCARSADAVLGAVLARLSAMTPPTIELPNTIGTSGSLNIAVAIIGNSGAGKSAAVDAAERHLPADPLSDLAILPLGSGEGIAEAYYGTVEEVDENGKTRQVRRQVRTSVLFEMDEGQAMAQLGGRQGSTLFTNIRSAVTGQRIGQANATTDRARNLPVGEYRFALIAGFQTRYAADLLNDAAGGTPQRFVFLPAEDPNIPDIAPAWPGEIRWHTPQHQAGPMAVENAIAQEIRAAALARARGELVVNELDAHRDLNRLKVAALLAVMEQRLDVNAEDWALAGMVLDTSDNVRASILTAAKMRDAEAERAATARHVGRVLATNTSEDHQALTVMARTIARHVGLGKCEGGCKRRCVSRSTPSQYRQRVSVDDAVEHAIELGWIVQHGDIFRVGESRPA